MKIRRAHGRRRFGRVIVPIAPLLSLLLTVVVVAGGWLQAPVAAQQATAGVLTTPPATLNCPTNGAAPAGTATTFTIVSNDSQAGYTAHEELAGRGANTAVGKTNAIIGKVLLDASGKPLACSRFDVDLRTLKSDEARRDNFLYRNTLETEQYPLATFILSRVDGLSKPLADGQSANVTLVGNLTVHGVTKLVAWQATATRSGDTLNGTATTTFNMPDFNITPPKVGPVLSLSETVRLDVKVSAKQAA